MCEYCKSCFADPNSDESMPILIGDDTVRTEKGHPLARISALIGYSNSSKCLNEKKSHIEFSLHTATDGENLAQVDIPIKYCPFCGTELPEPSVSE